MGNAYILSKHRAFYLGPLWVELRVMVIVNCDRYKYRVYLTGKTGHYRVADQKGFRHISTISRPFLEQLGLNSGDIKYKYDTFLSEVLQGRM